MAFLSTTSFAQEVNKKISGVLIDANNSPVAAASVTLLRVADSSTVKGAITNEQGKFELSRINNGIYLLRVTGVGYKKYVSIPLTLDEGHASIRLPVIILQRTNGATLKEVAVTAKKALVEEQIDRTVVNVDAMIGNAGSNALDVLARSPGVTVTSDGTISLNGNGAMVLIDGRPTYLGAADLAAYLRSVPAGVLDKIELMTNPPAKYDASGGAVINIRLRKNRGAGFTGNISGGYNQGTYGRSNDALNLSYKDRKVTLFSNLGYSLYKNYTREGNQRYFYNDDGSLNNAVLLDSRNSYSSNSWNGKIGMDYAASANTTYGIVFTGNTRPSGDRQEYSSGSYGADMKADSNATGHTTGNNRWKNFGTNVNFQHKAGTSGRELSGDLDYIEYSSKGDKYSPNYVTFPDGSVASESSFQYASPSDIHIYTAKMDYSHPLKGHAKLEGGAKYSYVNTDVATDYYNIKGAISIPDYGQADHFIYREKIAAAYVNTSKEWSRISLQAGLRMEHTSSEGHQAGNGVLKDSTFSRNYTGLFPTFFFNYKLDSAGNHRLVLRYGRRINRASYQQLNPFLVYRDKYSYSAGNPYLNPVYNYHVELTYRYKQYFSLGVHYDHVDDIIFSTTEAQGELFITRPGNIANGHILFLASNLSLSPTKWWNFNLNFRVGNLVNRSVVYSEHVDVDVLVSTCDLVNQFRWGKGWSGELFTAYRSRFISAQNDRAANYYLNAALAKNIWKDKGSIRLTLDDIFHSQITKEQTTHILHAAASRRSEEDSRRVGLSFSYRFGKESVRKRRHDTIGADEEQGRAN
jgi:hypothetical protein